MRYFATLGPNFNKLSQINEARNLGLDGVRINLSHSKLEDIKEWLDNIKTSDKIFSKVFEIIIDIKGMEERIKTLDDILVNKGDRIVFRTETKIIEDKIVYISRAIADKLDLFDKVSVDDGNIILEFIDRKEDDFIFLAKNTQTIHNNKSISILGKHLSSSNVSEEDIENIRYSKKYGIKSFMLPFVRSREDICSFTSLLESMEIHECTIYSKIEDTIGVENIEEIIEASDVIVIARGDLGNNCGILRVSAMQKYISKKCRDNNAKFMVVTQLLNSMVENPKPTRAELNDIYNSSLDGADYLMLTAETAVGKYPLEAIDFLIKGSKI